MHPLLAEFLGTMLVILLGNGVVANVILNKTKGNGGGWIVITTGWALAVFVGVAVAGPYSGAHLNPAVTLAMSIAGKFAWSAVPSFVAAQLAGAMTGACLVWFHYKDHLDDTADPGLVQACYCTAPAIRNNGRNFASEVVGTFVLIFTIFYFTGAELGEEKTPVGMGSLGALPVSLLVLAIGLSLGGTTGYAINPVRDFGPRIMHALLPVKGKQGSGWDYAWIPILGPFVGAMIAAALYLCMQAPAN
jgi:glycerol uptake facilitator protein